MKDLYEVLRRKEMDLARVRSEIQALRGIIPLLEDETNRAGDTQEWPSSSSPQRNRWPLEIGDIDRKNSNS